MIAVIQAGGKGVRLQPYTQLLPKPLMPVGTHPSSRSSSNGSDAGVSLKRISPWGISGVDSRVVRRWKAMGY